MKRLCNHIPAERPSEDRKLPSSENRAWRLTHTTLMILQNDFKRQWAEIGPAAMAAVERVGASGRYILGHEVEAFEGKLAEF